MPNYSLMAIVSLELDPFFENMPTIPEDLERFVQDVLLAIQNNEWNRFKKLAELLKAPQGFFGLEMIGHPSKGEVREIFINEIDRRITKAAREAGALLSDLNWSKEILLNMIGRMEDNQDNLISQTSAQPASAQLDFPEFMRRYEERANQLVAQAMYQTVQHKTTSINEPASLTWDTIQELHGKLAIIDPQYIHSSIDSLELAYIPNILNLSALRDIEGHLPTKYQILKDYFHELRKTLYDIDDALEFFQANELAQVALAMTLAIALKENLDTLKASVLTIISDVGCEDKVKDAFAAHVKMSIKEYTALQEKLSIITRRQYLLSEKVQPNKVNSILKWLGKWHNVSDKNW